MNRNICTAFYYDIFVNELIGHIGQTYSTTIEMDKTIRLEYFLLRYRNKIQQIISKYQLNSFSTNLNHIETKLNGWKSR